MNRNLMIIIVIVIVLMLVFVAPLLPFVISGYGGLASNVESIDHAYGSDAYVETEITPTVGVIRPNTLGVIGATDLRIEIGQPQFRGTETTYFNEIEETLDNGDVLKRTWEVRIAYFDMGFTIRTAGEGVADITNIDFWIEIKENEFNVFQDADDVRAYILEVVTVNPVEISDLTLFEVSPSAGGYSFDLDPLQSSTLPAWMSDSGYQDVLSDLEDVRFKVTVDRARPYWVVLVRAEQQATWNVEIRSLVFGFWEVLSPYDDWVPGEVWEGFFPFLDDLFAGLQLIIGGIFGLIVTVAVMRIPLPPLAKVVILGIVWIGVFVFFGGVALVG